MTTLQPASSPSLPEPSLLDNPRVLATMVHDTVRHACPPWMRSRSEDIGQTLLLRMLGRERRGHAPPLSRAYLRRAATHAVVDAIRSHSRRESLHRAHWACVERLGPSIQGGHSTDPLLARTLDDRLERLGSQSRQAVSLYLAGEPIRAIAERMGWNEKKASNTVFRSLARLRRDLAATGVTPTQDDRRAEAP